jgi:hypothetical protein
MSIGRRSLVASATTALIAPLLPRQGAVAQSGTVVDTLAAAGCFVRFLDLINRAGLTKELRGSGPFTVGLVRPRSGLSSDPHGHQQAAGSRSRNWMNGEAMQLRIVGARQPQL